MVDTFVYVILSILALGILIFIHELGHYFAARYVGMKVEAFGIGFGRAIYSWQMQGVEWRLNWLPFGGYVKIAGMEAKKGEDPYQVAGGFFSKTPLQRIFVSLAGPVVNLLFALLVFTLIWISGGREKPFSQFTSVIGWVDPHSEIYVEGVRPGDVILSYDDHPYHGITDHFTGPMTAGETLRVVGLKVNHRASNSDPFDLHLKPYPHPNALQEGFLTSGILYPASYVMYHGSPTVKSVNGLQDGDRLVWVDGEPIFSSQELKSILNDGRTLLTITRDGVALQKRIPRVPIGELRLNLEVREELIDWQFEAKLADERLSTLFYIPYNLNHDAVVENRLNFIDDELNHSAFPTTVFSDVEELLKPGDQIIAVNGVPVKSSSQLFYHLQEQTVLVIVDRSNSFKQLLSSKNEDARFEKSFSWNDLDKMVRSIGTNHVIRNLGDLHLLQPMKPKRQNELFASQELKAHYLNQMHERQKEIESIENSELKEKALKLFVEQQDQLYLGVQVGDINVLYNPNPLTQFKEITEEIWRSLKALFTGALSPKWLSGPSGIVQAMQSSFKVSYVEALFWLGVISLNLGFLNLLPIPVLDGGYVCLFLLEMVTRKKIKPEALERLILPFVVLLILFLLYTTYNDLLRIFGSF